MNILIVDDHAIVRRGLRQVLAEGLPAPLFGEAGSAAGLHQALHTRHWDLVILDLNLPDRHGLDVLKELKVIRPKLPVLVLSFYPETQYATRAIKAGAAGYVAKASAPEELTTAVEKVLSGGTFVSLALGEQLAQELAKPGVNSPGMLSDRELQIIRLIAAGHTLVDIADRLGLSAKTVSTYRSRLLDKLRLRTTADLIRHAIDARLTD
ncbi:MAG: Transcriptional regulator, LuxR family [Nitrospira sp.]|jgi:DNA-binding NarL/FixJ family response regulator|nr:Transcriptional regulator, LuxR family [Nitrospira sp.]